MLTPRPTPINKKLISAVNPSLILKFIARDSLNITSIPLWSVPRGCDLLGPCLIFDTFSLEPPKDDDSSEWKMLTADIVIKAISTINWMIVINR